MNAYAITFNGRCILFCNLWCRCGMVNLTEAREGGNDDDTSGNTYVSIFTELYVSYSIVYCMYECICVFMYVFIYV